MFDWFKRPELRYSNVVKFPEKIPTPYVSPPEESVPESMYSIGVTTEGTHMTFKMGYTTLTMTKQGCQQLIEQLEVFKNQLRDEE
jgi:hypothetical protein